MKKIIYASAVLAMAFLASCNKEESVGSGRAGRDCNLTVEITGGAAATRSVADADAVKANESKIYNLQVYVFSEDGSKLEGYAGKSDDVKSLDVSCKSGKKTICALVNYPDMLADVQTLSDLESKALKLSDFKLDRFVMFGKVSQFIEGNSTVTIDVYRLCSRIVIRGIENNFKLESLQTKEFKVTGIYVTNVQAINSLGMNAYQESNGSWYNKMKHESSAVESLLYDETDKVIAHKEADATAHYFYAMPNDFKASESNPDHYAGDWCKRYTRLVIEATIDGEVCYYPITMNQGFEPNKSYEIEKLVVTKKGSPDPDVPVDSEDIVVKINVVDWDVVLMGNEGVVTI